jgi:hypothetical protein
MGYLHINNLYKDQRVLLFRECYALEKVHGTSAHVRWADGRVHLSSGGESPVRFEKLFDLAALAQRFTELGHASVIIYGEAYGGSQQKQAWRYGPELRFVAFDVMIGGSWLTVPNAADVVDKIGLRFVAFEQVPTDLAALDAERDRPSLEAKRNGVVEDKPREGIIIRPLIELVAPRGESQERIIAKHKRDEERETTSPRDASIDPAKLAVLEKADAIALEWVTDTRLEHVLDKLKVIYAEGGDRLDISCTREVISAMIEDVTREGAGEIVDTKEARAAIGKRTAMLFHAKLKAALTG